MIGDYYINIQQTIWYNVHASNKYIKKIILKCTRNKKFKNLNLKSTIGKVYQRLAVKM